MDPKYWGRSFWLMIFIIIVRFRDKIEVCKRHLYVICSTLPCIECREHALEAIAANDVMSSGDINYIYYFFISLFNNLARDPRFAIDAARVELLRACNEH
ncbi:sulfhydryl oxidase [Western grey kangaroopox virus]|uniref:Sulfhydryl oxidase n=1 Tax=Western grey kangaroopox virus TaxID=1566307 RepID=A0A2C9DSJ9_9POXV|nr:sulfhydryl oxidase [Western grey kangaroopox virus]ATI20982.1 sulfhydryl oxidase [Western grey kangaroopox virus]